MRYSIRPPAAGKLRSTCLLVALTLLLVFSNSGVTSALSAGQRLLFERGIYAFDLEAGCTVDNTGNFLPSNIPPIWRDVLTKAAASRNTSASLLAAIYLTENGNEWRPFDHPWANSPTGAKGPFQFLDGTWKGHKTDGDGSGGEPDIMNVWDAAFSAADMIADIGATPTWPLGTLEAPMARNTLLYVAVAYNAGPGDAERMPADITLDGITEFIKTSHPSRSYPEQAKDYAMNVHALISSGFTKKGKPGYGDPRVAPGVEAAAATASLVESQGPVIVLDPGHGGTEYREVTDTETNIKDHDYPNSPEMEDVFDIALLVKAQLEKDGYTVLLTKNSAAESATTRQRADVANNAKAALAISIHDQAGADGGLPFNSANNHVYVQKDGLYRERLDGSHYEFNNPTVAALSQQYGDIFVKERSKAEGHTVTLSQASGLGERGLPDGNIWLVQLFSKVPWIYNEVGGNSAGQEEGLNDADKQKYANGLVNSVKAAIPADNSLASACSGAAGRNAMVQEALRLAWDTRGHTAPAYSGRFFGISKPEYQQTMPEVRGGAGFRYWDGDEAYSDCGVFVATVIHTTGVDPDYPKRGTYDQKPYLDGGQAKWEVRDDITNTADLVPGDVLIFDAPGNPGHTYLYVGPQDGPDGKSGTDDDFNSVSASFHSHVPQAANAHMDQGDYHFSVARLR